MLVAGYGVDFGWGDAKMSATPYEFEPANSPLSDAGKEIDR